MKNQFLKTSILLMLIIMSCSSNDSTDSNQENPPIEIKRFIKKIKKQNPQSFEKGSQFIYEEDKLSYVYLDDCSGTLYYFEYKGDGKISKRYEGSINLDTDTFNPSTFDLDSFKQNSIVLNYVYQGDKLVKMQINNDFTDYQLTYNNENKVETIEWFLKSIGLWSKITLTYSERKISNLNKKEFNTDGSLSDNYDYTFEFDSNPNPFYTLSDGFKLINLYTCTGFDYISSDDIGLKLFKNNVTKVYRNGTELYSATYQYNSSGYPTRISYTNLNGNVSGVDLITYTSP